MSYRPFNINNTVKVRLTHHGKTILRDHWVEFYGDNPIKYPYRPRPEDEHGWSSWQLWQLMEVFGPHMFFTADLPFETEIQVFEGHGKS